MVCVAWVFFRAESVGEAVDYLGRIFELDSISLKQPRLHSIAFISLLILGEQTLISNRKKLLNLATKHRILELLLLGVISALCWIVFLENEQSDFIYFQF